MWIDMGSETNPVLIVLYANALTENSTHVLSEPNIGDLEVNLCITMVVSTDVIRICQNALVHGSAERMGTEFNEPPTFRGYHRRILDTRDQISGGMWSPYGGFGIRDS